MSKDLRSKIIALHETASSNIFKRLKDESVNTKLIYRTIKLHNDTGSSCDRPRSGRPRSAEEQGPMYSQSAMKQFETLWINTQI